MSNALDSEPEEEVSEDWLVTYADAITLLMAFFVVMFSISEPSQERFEEVTGGIREKLTGEQESLPFQDVRQELTAISRAAGEQTQVKSTRRGVTFDFKSGRMFAPGSADILPEAVPLLDRVAQLVAFMGIDNYRIEVEGHTDDVPISTTQFPSNWELSAGRASSVVRFLISRGVVPERLTAIGFADTQQLVENRDEFGLPIPENQAENRRVVIRVEREYGSRGQR